MEQDVLGTIVLAILGSNGLFALMQFLISRMDNQKNDKSSDKKTLDRIEKRLDTQERDSCRTQMLLMLSDYPDQTAEIMKLAHHYFAELGGNWYMTSIFNQWLIKNKHGKPEWFNSED